MNKFNYLLVCLLISSSVGLMSGSISPISTKLSVHDQQLLSLLERLTAYAFHNEQVLDIGLETFNAYKKDLEAKLKYTFNKDIKSHVERELAKILDTVKEQRKASQEIATEWLRNQNS